MDTSIAQDVVSSNPPPISKFGDTKRKKPWEVFKNQKKDDDGPENIVQFDSFRDKCAQNQLSGSGFTAMLNNVIQQDNTFQIKLNKNQYYQNLSKNKKLFGISNYNQNPKQNRQSFNQGNQVNNEEQPHNKRFNNLVHNNFQKQNNYRGNKELLNENSNNANVDGNRQNNSRFNPFYKNEFQKENSFNPNTQNQDQQMKEQEEISKAKYFERKQKKISNIIEEQASRALRREDGLNVSDNEDPLIKYNFSDSSSVNSEGEEDRQKKHLTSSMKKKRTGLSRRRQKICGSWVRVCDNQKLDKPPSYKDYLGALTNANGKRPLEDIFSNRDEDLYEVNQELAQDAEDGELKAVADLEDGEIKMQEEDYYLKNTAEAKFEQEIEYPFPTRKIQQKPNKSKNFMNVSASKVLNTIRRANLEGEEDDATSKKKLKVPTREELLEQESKLLENQQKEEEQLEDPIQVLKRMNQIGNNVFNNRTGNNFLMQQTLASQQDAFLQQYFKQGKKNANHVAQQQDPNAPNNTQNEAKKEKRFDVKNYQVDLEKNMIENKVQMTEGLRNLVKIQNELYVSGIKKKNKQNKEITQSSVFSSGSSQLNKVLQQDSTEKELRDASQRLSNNEGMKEIKSKLNFDSNNAHPLLLQKEKQNNQFNKALNQFEEEVNRKEKLIKSNQQQQKKDSKDNEEPQQEKQKKEVKEGEEGSKAENEENNDLNEEEYNFEDEDLNEFEKFNEQLMQQEKMLEDLQKKNKEKVNEIKNSKSLDLGLGFGLDGGEKKEEELNPLERMIQDELDKTKFDKQQQNYRLMELQKLQENQHIQHLHLLAKSTTNDKKQHRPNNYNQKEDNQERYSKSQLHAMANNPSDRDNQRSKRNKFSDMQTLTPQLANQETYSQIERLKQLTNQRQTSKQESDKLNSQLNGIASLAQLQQQLFQKNQQIIQNTCINKDVSTKMETENSSMRSSKFSSHNPNDQQISYKNEYPTQLEVPSNKVQQVQRKVSFDKDVLIPQIIKNKENELRPEVYEKIVLEYIKMYKRAKEEVQLDKIKDPRLRARASNQLEEKSQLFAEQLIRDNNEKINNFIPMANDDHSLPFPSIQEDSGDKRKSSFLNFSVETNTMPANMELEGQQDDKVVYNYKVLKSDKTFISQEKNLIEKNNSLSFLQDSSQGPTAAQLLHLQKKEESHEQQQSGEINDMFKNEREIRYFKENNTMFCFKCNQNGHSAKWCTSQVEEKAKCIFCMGDHSKEYCTNYVCFKCYLVGHRIKDCAFEQSMDQNRCRLCRKKGHTIKQCGSLNIDVVTKNYDYYSINDTICINCDKLGHINCYAPKYNVSYDGLYKIDKDTLDRIS